MAANPNPTAQQQQSAVGLPSSSTFSFKAPFPVSPPPPQPPLAAAVSALKHRRVSLASPSSPRLVQPWSFRDEMGLHIQPPTPDAETGAAASSSPTATGAAVPEKKGKMRKLDPKLAGAGGGDELTVQDKKPRKKWSNEETQMLVQGCQIVCFIFISFPPHAFVLCRCSADTHTLILAWGRQLEDDFAGP